MNRLYSLNRRQFISTLAGGTVSATSALASRESAAAQGQQPRRASPVAAPRVVTRTPRWPTLVRPADARPDLASLGLSAVEASECAALMPTLDKAASTLLSEVDYLQRFFVSARIQIVASANVPQDCKLMGNTPRKVTSSCTFTAMVGGQPQSTILFDRGELRGGGPAADARVLELLAQELRYVEQSQGTAQGGIIVATGPGEVSSATIRDLTRILNAWTRANRPAEDQKALTGRIIAQHQLALEELRTVRAAVAARGGASVELNLIDAKILSHLQSLRRAERATGGAA